MEYEEIYQNALRTLDLFGIRAGKPFVRNGMRYSMVDGQPRDDAAIFFLTWGRDRSTRIESDRRSREVTFGSQAAA